MDIKDNDQRMIEGRLYQPNDENIMKEQLLCIDKLRRFNQTFSTQMDERQEMMKDMFGAIGENCYIEPPIFANFGCKHVFFGNNIYVNFNATLVDDANIYIGNDVMIAPNVTIATAAHPIDPELRHEALQYNLEVHVGNNVWIGANTVVLPGVTIGDNTVIGAGSVVTKDIPANVVAFGNPCKVQREISDHDKKYYYRDRKIDL